MGAILCLLSAIGFGAMAVFGKLAYDEGASVGTLLATRFVLAAALLWLVVACTRGVRSLRALPRRDVGIALALGAVVMVVCLIASSLGVRLALKVDPATALGG